jgi:hypothetical protein
MPHEREVGRGATELPRGKAASGPYRSASGEPPSTLSSSRCDEGSHSLEKSPRCDEGSHLVVYGCGGPQPLAGKQGARVPVPGHGLNPAPGRGHDFAGSSTRFRTRYCRRTAGSTFGRSTSGPRFTPCSLPNHSFPYARSPSWPSSGGATWPRPRSAGSRLWYASTRRGSIGSADR